MVDIVYRVVCVDQERALIEQCCGVTTKTGDALIGQGLIPFVVYITA